MGYVNRDVSNTKGTKQTRSRDEGERSAFAEALARRGRQNAAGGRGRLSALVSLSGVGSVGCVNHGETRLRTANDVLDFLGVENGTTIYGGFREGDEVAEGVQCGKAG